MVHSQWRCPPFPPVEYYAPQSPLTRPLPHRTLQLRATIAATSSVEASRRSSVVAAREAAIETEPMTPESAARISRHRPEETRRQTAADDGGDSGGGWGGGARGGGGGARGRGGGDSGQGRSRGIVRDQGAAGTGGAFGQGGGAGGMTGRGGGAGGMTGRGGGIGGRGGRVARGGGGVLPTGRVVVVNDVGSANGRRPSREVNSVGNAGSGNSPGALGLRRRVPTGGPSATDGMTGDAWREEGFIW